MPAPLSIIIPTLNSADQLPQCLASLMVGLDAGLIREVIISDGGSTDATATMAAEWGAVFISGPKSRGGQLRRGAEIARGDLLMFIHSDTVLTSDWPQDVLALPADTAMCFSLGFRATGIPAKLVAGWANLRTRAFGLPYGDQGMCLPRSLYTRIGGYPDQPLMEDVALVHALPRRVIMTSTRAWTGAEKYLSQGWFTRGAKNLWILTKYYLGVPPERLVKSYHPPSEN